MTDAANDELMQEINSHLDVAKSEPAFVGAKGFATVLGQR